MVECTSTCVQNYRGPKHGQQKQPTGARTPYQHVGGVVVHGHAIIDFCRRRLQFVVLGERGEACMCQTVPVACLSCPPWPEREAWLDAGIQRSILSACSCCSRPRGMRFNPARIAGFSRMLICARPFYGLSPAERSVHGSYFPNSPIQANYVQGRPDVSATDPQAAYRRPRTRWIPTGHLGAHLGGDKDERLKV